MEIPQIQNLHNQTFNSKLMEFVWLFQEEDGVNQFIFGITKSEDQSDLLCYIETGKIDSVGNYIVEPFYTDKIGVDHLVETNNWKWPKVPPSYDKFSNGEDLVKLAEEAIGYLE